MSDLASRLFAPDFRSLFRADHRADSSNYGRGQHMASPAIRMGNMHDVGSRVGISMTIVALGAVVGPPTSGAINAATGNFTFTGIYAGVSHHASPAFDTLDALCQEPPS